MGRHSTCGLVERACHYVAARLPSREIWGTSGLYLTRWTIFDAGKRACRLYLHRFHMSDEDRELHTHPWRWAVSIQLVGGYSEERRVAGSVVRRDINPCNLNFIAPDTAHRVDLLDPRGSWSLILTGPVCASWGFWSRDTSKFTPWREFIRSKRLAPIGENGGEQ